MTWIEGIGDEVTLFFLLLVVIVVGVVAWLSTSISDQPLVRTVLILERRAAHRQALEQIEAANAAQEAANAAQQAAVTTSSDTEIPDTNTENDESLGGTAYLPCDTNNQQNLNETAWELASNHTNEDGQIHIESTECEQTEPEDDSSNNVSTPEVEVDQESCALRARRVTFVNNRQTTLLEEPLPTERVQSGEGSSTSKSNAVGNIRIRLKYLNDDQKMVDGKLEEQLGDFKRRHFSPELSADKLVRLIFNGHVLQRDSETLQGCGLFDNCVVHCLVHQQRNRSDRAGGRDRNAAADRAHMREWDMGNALLISLCLLLGVGWYCRFLYAQLFNATTTVALAGLTGVLAISLVGIYMPDQDFPNRR